MFKASMLILISFVCFGSLMAQQEIDPEVQRLNRELAESYLRRDYNKAHAAASRLVEIITAKFGKNHLATAKALKNRGGLEKFKGDPKAAAKTFEEAVAIYKKQKDLSDHDLKGFADVLEALGAILAQKRLDSAQALFTQALEIREKTTGPESPEAAASLIYFANLNFWLRQFEKSASYYSRALSSLSKSIETSRQDFTLVYYRSECSFRKANLEDRFAELTKKFGPEGLRDDTRGAMAPTRTPKLIQAGVVNGKAVHMEKPKYPEDARFDEASGNITIDVLIDENGRVLSACSADKGKNASLVAASEASSLRWRFSPTTLDGNPVKVAGKITYSFEIIR